MSIIRSLKRKLGVFPGPNDEANASLSGRARLYEFEERFFVCSVRWIAETGSVTVLHSACEDDELGRTILRHLAEYDPIEWDLRDRKRTDWAAFQASSATTVKGFEAGLTPVDLSLEGSTVRIAAWPRSSSGDKAVSATGSAVVDSAAQIGASVRQTLREAKGANIASISS